MYKCAQYTRMYMCLKVAPEGAFIAVYITIASDKKHSLLHRQYRR